MHSGLNCVCCIKGSWWRNQISYTNTSAHVWDRIKICSTCKISSSFPFQQNLLVGVNKFLLQVLNEKMQFSHLTTLDIGQMYHTSPRLHWLLWVEQLKKYFVEVNTFFLNISFHHQSCTIPLHFVFAFTFDFVDPLISNNFSYMW